ncbi:hypothetical protein BVRB_5g123160 [Beta vulgaris subsp. vulgaris]|uniref:Uncharacterized protein n=1 Tax=Beta vulgaris subsp. vulgaris TaxID=3555 RepID=A0A0J8BD52_BETVV|nr:hypothetical protein BVRB_5g123160 [Beta vulgaris subsp. vulgaris]
MQQVNPTEQQHARPGLTGHMNFSLLSRKTIQPEPNQTRIRSQPELLFIFFFSLRLA